MNLKIGPLGTGLIFWGATLFLIGLIQGALIPFFLNPRMALSAHLAAVQSGMALMIFGVIWELIYLNKRSLKIAYYSSVLSMYLIWFSIVLSAIFGASEALPIAGKGYAASYLIETLISITIYVGAGLGINASFLIVTGLSKFVRAKSNNPDAIQM